MDMEELLLENKTMLQKLIEEIHATKSEKLIELCNSGIMMVNKDIFFKKIKLIKIK